ncbi:methionyl-tRNA formyltransferase [bacterium]|nr:methionyl-tRNA formyltransferase [bacterium]
MSLLSQGPIKICFLGTPDFAAAHLKSILNNSNFKIVGVVTQPDRPAGRKMQLTPSAVKIVALENNLPVLTPENLRKEPDTFEKIKSWNADVAVVVAFGQIVSQEFLDSFKFGAVNVHGSLLPRWRGAAPIQRSIEAGDTETGVSLQRMVKKLDAGPIIGERTIMLNNEITATELYDKLAVYGCELLNEDLIKYVTGEIQPFEQDEAKVTLATKIEKEESLLSWQMPAEKMHNKVRAFTMGPGTYVMYQGKRLKIHKTKVIEGTPKKTPATVLFMTHDQLVIQCFESQISLLEVQPESKAKISIADFLKSHPLKEGDLFV